jgi:hypothetical protein
MGSLKGLNWADDRDNFQTGVIYPSGLTATDDRSTAAAVADRIVGQMYALTGANTVRLPINEATVGGFWSQYTGAIDAALAHGSVILCYWAAKAGRPADRDAFREMWATVVGEYGDDDRVYLEPINEPHGFGAADLNDFYGDWLAGFPNVARERLILDGSKYAQVPATVGSDRRLDGCLLGYHEYSFFDSFRSEAAWRRHIQRDVGGYHGRTVCTEFGAVMNAGALGKRRFHELLDYGTPSKDEFVRYVRGATEQFREWGMGSVYWPGVRDGDVYALCSRSGSGSDTALSIANASGLARIQYGWGAATTPPADGR